MTVWVIEFDHKHGTEVWVAATEAIANEVVKTIKTKRYHWAGDYSVTLEEALADWPGFTGDREFFRVYEEDLVSTVADARSISP